MDTASFDNVEAVEVAAVEAVEEVEEFAAAVAVGFTRSIRHTASFGLSVF